jgi:glutamyl-tRNA synthetase
MAEETVTRFAPSPTGFLHIGGARTALFNWLYARHCDGRMLLRIEDTDRARSTDEAIGAILEGLTWLGLHWDGEVMYQHTRAGRHREVVDGLVAAGNAYRCYASPQELAEMREAARAAGRPPRYDGRWRDREPGQAPAGARPAIRLKARRSGQTVIADRVQGDVTFANDELDDLVLLRSDGTPTYMLAVVVDDHDMGVTHVIRGDDHLTNAARQAQIYEALGWSQPEWAHIPLIHGADGAKLSKRHGALGIEAYRAMGYLAPAMRNYLVRLGWSHGDDELMSLDEMTRWFDLDGINRAPARLDLAKLENMNGHYLRASDDDALAQTLLAELAHLETGALVADRLDEELRRRLRAGMPGLRERSKTLNDLIELARYTYVARPVDLDDRALKVLDGDARALLADLAAELATLDPFSAEAIEFVVRALADRRGVKLGALAQPLRAALSGRTISPGVFEMMAVLGRAESLARIGDQTDTPV